MTAIAPSSDWVLDYEIRLSARYRRFVSIVLIRTEDDTDGLCKILAETIRTTDTCFTEDHGLSLIMGETAHTDAVQAIQRYRNAINGSMNVHYSVASYPSDGKTPAELNATAHRRLDRARALGRGAVVAQ